jgi:hypothetical protein
MLQVRPWKNRALFRFFETEIRAWYGLEPLGKVFWGYGVLASTIMAVLYALALVQQRVIVQQLLLIFFGAYTVWIITAVWRCAQSAPPIWQALARSLTVAWAANATLVVGFLELDFIGRFLAM